ncbi:preprotein translocase subunit (chloroplast) [Nannochloropsis gaditana]|uniref:Preprotein translocase subunit n=2 Tax=Nannochloropsis gaditana TaxID=72520 RepID=K9ZXG3_9STRA|nr:preprotein translocase subunit [Nannochloropsis gaditana]AFZ64236.1 preprotein translocase subunit [Nannochloropsis gaditana]AGI98629.1 preprotein translocase subunit [Nannochloropsis gaditana]
MNKLSTMLANMFSAEKLRKSAQDRVLSLFVLGACLRFLSKIPLPCIDYSLLPASNRPCFLALGILPLVQASLLVQVFNSIKPKSEDDDFDKYQKIQKQVKIVSAFIAILVSVGQVRALSPVMYSYTLMSKFILGTTLVTGGLVLIWISEWVSESFSISGSVVVLTFTSVIDDVIRLTLEASNLDTKPRIILGFYVLAVAAFTTFISKSTVEFPILSSKQSYSEQSKPSLLPFAINPGAVMGLVSAESLLRLIQSGFNQISFISLGPTLIGILISLLRFVFIITFSYYCSKLQVDSDKVSKELITMNMTILRKSPGQETQNYLEDELKRTYLSAGLMLALLVGVSDILDNYYPTIGLKSNLSSLLILFGTMLDLEDRLFDLGLKKA